MKFTRILISTLSTSIFAVSATEPVSPHAIPTYAGHKSISAAIDQHIVFSLERMFSTEGLIFEHSATNSSTRQILTYRGSGSASSLSVKQSPPPESIRNDLLDGECDDIIIIFARGTSSPGNIGTGVGPVFINAISEAQPGSVIAQGVINYPADIWGFLAGGSSEGAVSMANLTTSAASQCPGAKIVLSGYSQGAQVTHLATQKLDPALDNRIAAIVTFGDPKRDENFPRELQSKAMIICNAGDLICDGLPILLPQHGSKAYEKRMAEAVAWVTAHV